MTNIKFKNTKTAFQEYIIDGGAHHIPVLQPKPSVSIVNSFILMPFQHMLSTAYINANLEALRSPLANFAECSCLNQQIYKSSFTQNFLVKFFNRIKKILFPISNTSNLLKIKIPHNNLWSNSLQCSTIVKLSPRNVPKVNTNRSALDLHLSKITCVKFYCVDMSLKPMFPNQAVPNGFKGLENTSMEPKTNLLLPLRATQATNLFNQLLYDFGNPFCETVNNDTTNNSTANILPHESSQLNRSLMDECSDVKSAAHCARPIQLGMPTWRRRQRTSSEHSDDIYFLSSTDDEDADDDVDVDDDDDDVDVDDDDDDDSDDDGDSEEENEDDCEILDDVEVIGNNYKLKSSRYKQLQEPVIHKKVRFNLKPEVHVMHAWNFAYRSARKGNWEAYARDRTRFQHRIQRASLYLDPVLNQEYRNKIYKCRFADQSELQI